MIWGPQTVGCVGLTCGPSGREGDDTVLGMCLGSSPSGSESRGGLGWRKRAEVARAVLAVFDLR